MVFGSLKLSFNLFTAFSLGQNLLFEFKSLTITESSTGEVTFIEIKFAYWNKMDRAHSLSSTTKDKQAEIKTYQRILATKLVSSTFHHTQAKKSKTSKRTNKKYCGEFYVNKSSLTSWAFSYCYLISGTWCEKIEMF